MQTVLVSTNKGPRPVLAEICGALMINRAVDSAPDDDAWVVAHLYTGMALQSTAFPKDWARELMRTLAQDDRIDWHSIGPVPLPEREYEDVQRIVYNAYRAMRQ